MPSSSPTKKASRKPKKQSPSLLVKPKTKAKGKQQPHPQPQRARREKHARPPRPTVPKVSEAQFQRMVIELAELHGWWAYHVPDSRQVTCRGFLDTHFLHPVAMRYFVRELKVKGGRLSEEQKVWIEVSRACGLDAGVWYYPTDWDEIVETLSHPYHAQHSVPPSSSA